MHLSDIGLSNSFDLRATVSMAIDPIPIIKHYGFSQNMICIDYGILISPEDEKNVGCHAYPTALKNEMLIEEYLG